MNEKQKISTAEVTQENTIIGDLEEKILSFWQNRDIFKKSEVKGKEEFIFYDGPPFATGVPHYGHILASTIKDAIPRYESMRGKKVFRRWGWDCHGLPLENQIEAELGLKTKRDIEKLGIAVFNETAKKSVLRYADVWEKVINRIGRFVDMDNDYKTMDPTYTESVWWAFKTLYDKKLIFKAFKSMHLCPRCGTTLSNFEVNLGYKDITDLAVTIKFELLDEPKTFLLAWTTTPWTLPGNAAIGVHPGITYIKVEKGGERFILAKEKLQLITGEYSIASEFKGRELIGKSYKPIFDYYKNRQFDHKDNAWKVYGAPYVTIEEGTGIVHIAPAFGEEDMELAKKEHIPLIHHIDAEGKFKPEVKDFAGLLVKPKENHQQTDILIIKNLAHRSLLFSKEKIIHSYPHCWRCETPLLNYAASSWFVKVTDIKEKIVKENKKINWVPSKIGTYRFGNWLLGAPDWAISRSRFWGAPLPVWEDEKGKNRLIIGSFEELKAHVKKSDNHYFVMRHGEAEHNKKGIISSKNNNEHHLTENGGKQVKMAAEFLQSKKINFIVTSPSTRAKETAAIIVKILNLPSEALLIDERLSEINAGSLDGKSVGEYHRYFALYKERFEKTPPGGENYREIKRRVGTFLYEIENKYKKKNILFITHEVPSWLLLAVASGLTEEEAIALRTNPFDFLETGEVRKIDFVPIPHNKDFELDFHRPYIDEIVLHEHSGNYFHRIPEVFDCWFESGSMPYAQNHYPFETKRFNPKKGIGFPADFIAEGLDQTRGWFYSLLVLGVALFGETPYKNVIVNGLILGEDGQKMSKRLKNYPDPTEVIRKYGADALRYYLLSSPLMRGEDFSFLERGVDEVFKKLSLRLLNIYTFYDLYRDNKDNVSFKELTKAVETSKDILDQWILSRFRETNSLVTKAMEAYELDLATRPLLSFIEDFSTWYLRRSRERLKEKRSKEGGSTLATIRFILIEFAKLMAPFMPFIAEHIYQKVKTKDSVESVHLESWPKSAAADKKILADMAEVRRIVSEALKKRAKAQIKVRQPLSFIMIASSLIKKRPDLQILIKNEVNVKEIKFAPRTLRFKISENIKAGDVLLDTKITPVLEEEGIVRDLTRYIQDSRKNMDLKPNDVISVSIDGDEKLLNRLNKWKADVIKITGAGFINFGKDSEGKPVNVGEHILSVTIKKI